LKFLIYNNVNFVSELQLKITRTLSVTDPVGSLGSRLPLPYKTAIYNAKLTKHCFAFFQSTPL